MRIEPSGGGLFVVKDENERIWFGPASFKDCEEYLKNNPTPPSAGLGM